MDALTLRCDSPKNVIETFGPTTSECLSISNFRAAPIACKLNTINSPPSEGSIQLTIDPNSFKNVDKYDINWMSNEFDDADDLCDDVKFDQYKLNSKHFGHFSHAKGPAKKQKYRIIKRKDFPNDRIYEEACMREAWLIENYESVHGQCFDDLYEIGSDSDDSHAELKQIHASSDTEGADETDIERPERCSTPLSIKNQIYLSSLPGCMNTVREMEKIRSNAYFYSFESMREQEKMKKHVLQTRGLVDDGTGGPCDSQGGGTAAKAVPKAKPLPKFSDFNTSMEYWDAVYSLSRANESPKRPQSPGYPNEKGTAGDQTDHSDPQKSNNRCNECNKKLHEAIAMKCHCGQVFCIEHRYAESHRCSFDFKGKDQRAHK